MHEKITTALEKAKNYIEETLQQAKSIQDEANHIWHASAELEYALFLFSIINQEKTEKESWKIDPKTKQMERKELLKTIRDLIVEGIKNIKDNLDLAHENVWMARGYLLTIQNEMEKTHRKKVKE